MKDPDTFLYWKMQFIGKMPLIDRNIKAVMGGIDLFKLKKGDNHLKLKGNGTIEFKFRKEVI